MDYKQNDRASAIGSATCEAGLQAITTKAEKEFDEKSLIDPFSPTPSLPSSSSLSSLSSSSLTLSLNLNSLTLNSSEQESCRFEVFEILQKFSASLAGKGHSLRTLADAWEYHLRTLGWTVMRRLPVFLPPLQKHVPISLYVAHPYRIAIEFDLKKPSAESVLKLQHFDGLRVLVLRQTNRATFAPHIDLVVPCHCRPLPRDTAELATREYLAEIKAKHDYRDGIDPDHVYWKCEKACRDQSVPFTKRRLRTWLDNEFLPTRSLAKPRCKVCQTRFVAKDGERCMDCRYKPR